MNSIKDIDNLVELSVRNYKSDWYKYDRPRAQKDGHFVIMLRNSGVDCLFMGAKKSYENLIHVKAYLDSNGGDAIYHYCDGKVTLINRRQAKKLLEKAIESCPEGYIEDCKRLQMNDFCPTVEQYKEWQKEQDENVNAGYAMENLADWTNHEWMPY